MMAEKKRQSLGRGLDALLGEETKERVGSDRIKGSRQVPVERLPPGRNQPRHSIDEELIEELAQSIRENGIIQPLLVRQHPDDQDAFEIIAGERRWRAAQMAKVHEVPVVIRDLNDQESLEIGLVENLQRQDLSPLDEAIGYQPGLDQRNCQHPGSEQQGRAGAAQQHGERGQQRKAEPAEHQHDRRGHPPLLN